MRLLQFLPAGTLNCWEAWLFITVFFFCSLAITTYLAIEDPKLLHSHLACRADPMDSVARLQLGRALALSGDTAKARAAYEDFLNLWSAADPDTSLLKQARAEFARLP